MVYYRTYRPQTIADLDSKALRDSLTNVVSGKEIPHAFLFSGPKGLGKTSAARIIAKAVNCERIVEKRIASRSKEKKQLNPKRLTLNASIEPCNECGQCISITNGSNIDVLEIDGASNRGIDEIRDLREKIRLSPANATKKIYIIDEVHMLTTEAFNALLKTLEEPPAHAMFIFCTTELHKVPSTILSRCFHVSFKKATEQELVHSFERIAKGEKLTIDKEALLHIASLSDGSFRDGAKALEEVVLLAGKGEITKELIEEKYKVVSLIGFQNDMLLHLAKRDVKNALLLVVKVVENGLDMKYFIEQLIHTLHQQLLQKVGILDTSDVEASALTVGEIKTLIALLAKAHTDVKLSPLPQLPLELAIIDWCQDTQIHPTQSSHSPSGTIRTRLMERSGGAGADGKQINADTNRRESVPQSASIKVNDTKDSSNILKHLIDKVKTENFSLAGVLRSCKVESFNDKALTLTTAYTFHKEKLEDKRAREVLEEAAEAITGNPVSVSIVLKER